MVRSATRWPTRTLFDVRIDAVTAEEVLSAVDRAIAERDRMVISVVNAAKIVYLERDQALRRAVLSADLILADGMSIVWACRLLRAPLPERVTGIDLMMRMLEQSHVKKYRVYLLGAKDDVLARVLERIAREYPGIVIVGSHNGYFDSEEEKRVAEEIIAGRPDLLLVAMSSPRKERFIAKWTEVLNVPVCHGVGGSFDVFSGKVNRAPTWIQRMGMEWAYRVAQEPKRLFGRYMRTNAVFGLRVLREVMQRIVRYMAGSLQLVRVRRSGLVR